MFFRVKPLAQRRLNLQLVQNASGRRPLKQPGLCPWTSTRLTLQDLRHGCLARLRGPVSFARNSLALLEAHQDTARPPSSPLADCRPPAGFRTLWQEPAFREDFPALQLLAPNAAPFPERLPPSETSPCAALSTPLLLHRPSCSAAPATFHLLPQPNRWRSQPPTLLSTVAMTICNLSHLLSTTQLEPHPCPWPRLRARPVLSRQQQHTAASSTSSSRCTKRRGGRATVLTRRRDLFH